MWEDGAATLLSSVNDRNGRRGQVGLVRAVKSSSNRPMRRRKNQDCFRRSQDSRAMLDVLDLSQDMSRLRD